ncbi:hypothetical protein CRG98_039406, partial [Punica granatum]
MFQAYLPIEFWGECISTAAHLINITPSSILSGKTPFELLFRKKPDYQHIRVFGCLCYAHLNPRIKDKFGPRSRKCIFIGYPFGKKGWRVYDLEDREVLISRDVHFYEDDFPFIRERSVNPINAGIRFLDTSGPAIQGEIPFGSSSAQDSGLRPDSELRLDNGLRPAQFSSAEPSQSFLLAPPGPFAAPPDPAITGPPPAQPVSSSTESNYSHSSDPATNSADPITSLAPPADSIARSKASRNIRTLSWLNDYVSHTARCSGPSPLIISPTPSTSP